jgi:hypothetical protein
LSDASPEFLARWLEILQEVKTPADTFAGPAVSVASLGALLRRASVALPFDIDPTGFRQRLENSARGGDTDG